MGKQEDSVVLHQDKNPIGIRNKEDVIRMREESRVLDPRESYFFIREPETNRPMACFVHIQGKAYGLSICSIKDSPNKEKGLMVAARRAEKALLTGKRGQVLGELIHLIPVWLYNYLEERGIKYMYHKYDETV